jgi:hypothetical protein
LVLRDAHFACVEILDELSYTQAPMQTRQSHASVYPYGWPLYCTSGNRTAGLCNVIGEVCSVTMRWPPLLGQELAGVKIESSRLMMPGYAARSLVSDGITLPA